MIGSIEDLFLAVLCFVASHFALAAVPVRARLVELLSERGYLLFYSVISAVLMVWLVKAYGAAPLSVIWPVAEWAVWVPNLLMPISCVLIVCGLTTQSPTSVGGEAVLDSPQGPRGILTITRHPFLWGTGLWALSHLPANGSAADVLLFGGMAILSFVGMGAIDHKRRVRIGAAWGPFELTTSILPFRAILEHRVSLDWSGIGWWRPLLGLVIWQAMLHGHVYVMGADPLPIW